MRPPAKPRVPPKPVTAKSAMPAPAAPSRAPQGRPATQAQRRTAAATEAIPRAEQPRPAPQAKPAAKPAKASKARKPGKGALTTQRGRPTVSTAMTRRLAEKRAMQRHRTLRLVAIWVASAAALAGLVWLVFFSSVLALDASKARITGQGDTIDVAQVQAIVQEQDGVPLPRIDTVGLRARILELAPVKDVRIMRGWPHGLDVTLAARVPVAAVPVEGGVALVDVEGVHITTVAEPPAGLPMVDADLAAENKDPLLAALHVLAALPDDLAGEVAHVSATSRDDVRTTLHSGQVVKWGSDAKVTLKIAVVQTLRQQAPDASVFDVSSPDLPVTR